MNNIPTDQDFIINYNLDHPLYRSIPSFRYYDLPVMGFGPKGVPIMELDSYIDTSEFPKIYRELEANKDKLVPHTKRLVVNGVVPEEINGRKSIDSILLNPDKWIDFDYGPDIKDLPYLSQVKSYFYKKFNIPEAWQGVCHMREYTNYANKNKPSNWLPLANDFPLLTKFIDSLPFKILGYALFFISNGDSENPAFIHRDTYHKSHHKSNFINILFDQKPRPFFVYDSITKEKTYVSPDCCMYTFNESDLHGADIESEPRYMLRIEGIFSDDFATELGLIKHGDYYEGFDWSYDKPQQFLNSVDKINIYDNTDI